MTLKQLSDFLKSASLQPGCRPGLARVLEVSHGFLTNSNISWLPNKILRYKGQHKNPSMGFMFAILDEMTTNATFLNRCPTPPGASIHIRLELTHAAAAARQTFQDEFVMDSMVTKSGKTISFSDCKVYDTDGSLIAFGSQIKYLPTGSWLTDTLFNSKTVWDLFTRYYVSRVEPPIVDSVEPIEAYLIPESQSIGRAIFPVTTFLTNPFEALHGGAQGMMMEIVGASLAKALLKTDAVLLTMIQVDYQATGRHKVEVTAQEIAPIHDNTVQLSVQLVATKTNRLVSSGQLRFVGMKDAAAETPPPIPSRM